jgi:putative transposase
MENSTKTIRRVKSIVAKEIFKRHQEVKQKLWAVSFGLKVFMYRQ